MKPTIFMSLLVMLTALCMLWGCGGSGSSSTSPTTTSSTLTALTTTYKVEYTPVTTAKDGKSTFKIKLTNRSDGTAAAGKTITLTPMMYMTSMSHSAPFDAPVDNGDGTYTSSIYYLMDGDWTLTVAIGSETATFNITVAAATGSTIRATLKGITDKIAPMSGTTPVSRTYYLFNEGLSGGTFSLFIAARDDSMMLSFPAVSSGSTLHDQDGNAWTVSTILVEASSDGGTTWVTATPGSVTGHWTVAGLGSFTSGGTIKVRVTINGEQKTTDGSAVSTTNGSTTFTIVAGS